MLLAIESNTALRLSEGCFFLHGIVTPMCDFASLCRWNAGGSSPAQFALPIIVESKSPVGTPVNTSQ
jgi:hypothetical protein